MRALLAAIIGAALIVIVGVVGLVRQAPAAEATPIQKRAFELLEWIVSKDVGYDKVPMYPRMAFWSAEHINRLRYGSDYNGQTDVLAMVLGKTVVLQDDFTIGRDDWILVHEMVHVLQNVNKRTFECNAAMEFEAYMIQRLWVRETGRGVEPDPIRLLLLSSCGEW